MKGQTVIKELFTVPELGPKATGLDQWSQIFFRLYIWDGEGGE